MLDSLRGGGTQLLLGTNEGFIRGNIISQALKQRSGKSPSLRPPLEGRSRKSASLMSFMLNSCSFSLVHWFIHSFIRLAISFTVFGVTLCALPA
jgi:hypothetical protein